MSDRKALIALRDAVVNCWFPADVSARDLGLAVIADETGLLVIRKMYDAFAGSVDAAIALLEAVLPGWGWRIASCHLSDDAFVFPDYNCPVHGARLRDTVPTLVDGVEWSEFTDVDLRPSGNPARALLIATLNALIEETDQ